MDEPPVAHMLEVAASTAPLLERARELVDILDRWLPVDAIWLTLADPDSNVYATIGSSGLEQRVLDYLDRPSVAHGMQLTELKVGRAPVRVSELPMPVDAHPTWADCLIPADCKHGLAVPLVEPEGPYLGMLSLLFSRTDPPSVETRDHLGRLAPLIAQGVSPMRSLLASARLVYGATGGVVLLRNGANHVLPGMDDDALGVVGTPVLRLARNALLGGQIYRTFLWPTGTASQASSHARVTVLAAADLPPFVLGTVLMTRDPDCNGLTARELEVLGLLVDGRSNQQIAEHLVIAARTVATHVEHILHKLSVPTRTLAAVRAEREGCYVPPRSSGDPSARPAARDEPAPVGGPVDRRHGGDHP